MIVRQTWVGVIIWPATPKTMATPARSREPGMRPATIGITMATWPWLMPVRMPMTKLVSAMMTGTGSAEPSKQVMIWCRMPVASRSWMKKRMQPTLRRRRQSAAPTNTSLTLTPRFIIRSTGMSSTTTAPMARAAERLKAIMRTTLRSTGAMASTTLMRSVLRCSDDSSALRRFSSNLSGRTMTNQPVAKATTDIQKRWMTRSATLT